MAEKISVKQLRMRIMALERALFRDRLATDDEIKSVADRFKDRSGKDLLWEHWAILRGMVIGKKATHSKADSIDVSEESLAMAVKALRDASETVEIPSIGKIFTIHPASWDRIERIEAHEWWLNRLILTRAFLIDSVNSGKESEVTKGEICSGCDRPLEAGKLGSILIEIREEMCVQRSMLLAQVIASSPAPVDKPVSWSSKITPEEEILLKQAYHRVNYDRIHELPTPRSEKGSRDLPQSWSFMFSTMEDRHKKPAAHFMRNRSLASIVAYLTIQAVRDQSIKDQVKTEAKHGGQKARGRVPASNMAG